jgi:hypothetical protein
MADELKQYLVSWTITVESDSPEGAVETAMDAMAEGNIAPEVEELEDLAEGVDLS